MQNLISTDLDYMALVEVVIETSIKCFIPILLIIVLYMVSASENLIIDPDLRAIEKPSEQVNSRPDIQWTRTALNKIFIFDIKDSSGVVPISMFSGINHTYIQSYRVDTIIRRGVYISASYNMRQDNNVLKKSVHPALLQFAFWRVDSKETPLFIDVQGKAHIKKSDIPLARDPSSTDWEKDQTQTQD